MCDGMAAGMLGAVLENATQNPPSPTPIIHPHDFRFKNCKKIVENPVLLKRTGTFIAFMGWVLPWILGLVAYHFDALTKNFTLASLFFSGCLPSPVSHVLLLSAWREHNELNCPAGLIS